MGIGRISIPGDSACRAKQCAIRPTLKSSRGLPLVRDRSATSRPEHGRIPMPPAERRWNIVRLKSDLDHEDLGVRLITVHNAGLHMPAVPEAVNVLRIALGNSAEQCPESGTCPRVSWGKTAADAVEEYEAASTPRQPDDLAVRILLLGTTSLDGSCRMRLGWPARHMSSGSSNMPRRPTSPGTTMVA